MARVLGSGQTALVRMEKLGQDIVAPASPRQRKEALLSAFNNVPAFKAVAEFYGDKKIPEDEFFLNTLTREFKIPRDRVDTFSQVFVANLDYLRAFDVAGKETTTDETTEGKELPDEATGKAEVERKALKHPRVREFLDTLVMMPFGDWFDRYYQEVYVPAIREAGFDLLAGGRIVQYWQRCRAGLGADSESEGSPGGLNWSATPMCFTNWVWPTQQRNLLSLQHPKLMTFPSISVTVRVLSMRCVSRSGQPSSAHV